MNIQESLIIAPNTVHLDYFQQEDRTNNITNKFYIFLLKFLLAQRTKNKEDIPGQSKTELLLCCCYTQFIHCCYGYTQFLNPAFHILNPIFLFTI